MQVLCLGKRMWAAQQRVSSNAPADGRGLGMGSWTQGEGGDTVVQLVVSVGV